MGLPGSGKTTLANELGPMLNAKRLNADEVRSPHLLASQLLALVHHFHYTTSYDGMSCPLWLAK